MHPLLALALALGARTVAGWSPEEEALCRDLPPTDPSPARRRILAGEDPLGEAFCQLRTPEDRRPSGATYTPAWLVASMLSWAQTRPVPHRIVDPGVGSGRFLVAAGRAFPDAQLLGIELDPIAAILARGHIAAAGLADRSEIRLGDYRSQTLPAIAGRTLFLGNPPYVRHHGIAAGWKAWLTGQARAFGLEASQLAGLHVHFFLATARLARPGDLGCFVTSAEWLDVNYGRLVRELLLGPLGGTTIVRLDAAAAPFPDATTTAAITCFEVGAAVERIPVRRQTFGGEVIQTLGTPRRAAAPAGFVELGELCRVHRGQVTGANEVWIAGPESELPSTLLFPSITRARELFGRPRIDDLAGLRRVIDLPVDLDTLDADARQRVERLLAEAKARGADRGYIARKRRAWWSVGLKAPAPILATYMARRPPAFVRNPAGARHINIAHGLYPREALEDATLDRLAAWLSGGVALADGRTYAGGLTKFEPREMERLLVPAPALLTAG